MDLPLIFSQIRNLRAFGLTRDLKMRYGCIYPYGICNILKKFDSWGYLNIHGILTKLCYGKTIRVFKEFKLLGFHLNVYSLGHFVIYDLLYTFISIFFANISQLKNNTLFCY